MGRVVWIGGSTVAGKSSVARWLAARHGLLHVDLDATWPDHASRRDPNSSPATDWWLAGSTDEIWIETPVPELVQRTVDYHRERFEHIVEDVRAAAEPLVVEGFQLLPELVAPLLDDSQRAIWLISDDAFRQRTLTALERGWTTPRTTRDPGRALRNRLERDRPYADVIREQADRLRLSLIEVNGDRELEAIAEEVEADLTVLRGSA